MRTGYKLFNYKNGKLFPLYILTDEEVPIGKWLKAKSGPLTSDGKHVKGKMILAYRPGWHIACNKPEASQIKAKPNQIWAEVEYNDKNDYNTEAHENGFLNGKFAEVRACLKRIPKDGFYYYKTSVKQKEPWAITGEMRVVRLLTENEVKELCCVHSTN